MKKEIGLTDFLPHWFVPEIDKERVDDLMMVYPRRYIGWTRLSDGKVLYPGAKVGVLHLHRDFFDAHPLGKNERLLGYSLTIQRGIKDSLERIASMVRRYPDFKGMEAFYMASQLITPALAEKFGFDAYQLINPITMQIHKNKGGSSALKVAGRNDEWRRAEERRKARKPMVAIISQRTLLDRYGGSSIDLVRPGEESPKFDRS